MQSINDKVVIITGAASGLGACDARTLAANGAKVVLTDINVAGLEALSTELNGALWFKHDVSSETDWQQVVDGTLDRYGRLDGLVNNAGIALFADIETQTLAQFRLQNQIMSEGVFLGCQHAVRAMKATGGSIINISSIGAIKGIAEIPGYAAAKGAMLSLTRSVAVHCVKSGYKIRCNAILPGTHDTPMTANALATIGEGEDSVQQILEGRQGHPQNIADAVMFLLSDHSSYINGTQLVVDNTESIV